MSANSPSAAVIATAKEAKVYTISSDFSRYALNQEIASYMPQTPMEMAAAYNKIMNKAANKQIKAVVEQGGAVVAFSVDEFSEGEYTVSVHYTLKNPRKDHTQIPYNFDVFGL